MIQSHSETKSPVCAGQSLSALLPSVASPRSSALLGSHSSSIWLHSAEPRARYLPAQWEGPSHSEASCAVALHKQRLVTPSPLAFLPLMLRSLVWISFYQRKGKNSWFDPCSTNRAETAQIFLLQPSDCFQQSQGDKRKDNCNSLGTAVAQFIAMPHGSLKGMILAMWGSR